MPFVMPKGERKSRRSITEISQAKTRSDEERFYVKFSETQLNAVLLLILANTFFVQGAARFIEQVSLAASSAKMWFFTSVTSLLLLILSVGMITFGGVMAGLKIKRVFNMLSFLFFLLGISLFVFSLIYLMVVLFGQY